MKLRPSIRIEGGLLHDTQTGFRLELSDDAGALLSALPLAPNAYDANTGAFLEHIAAIGLSDATSRDDAVRRQGRYVIEQAASDQRERVRATVERACASTPLHAAQLSAALRDPAWEIESLPLLQRTHLRRQFPDGLTSRDVELRPLLASGDVVAATTSGSSGERLQVFSDTRIPRLPPDIEALWELPGLESGGPIRTAVYTSAICSGAMCSAARKPRAERLVQEHTLLLESPPDAFALTHELVERTLSELEEFQPQILFGHPIYLRMLAQQALHYGLPLPRPRALVLSYQLVASALRRSLRTLYAAPIFDMYAATELGGSQIGISCSHGRLHVRLDQVFLELLGARGPVKLGELGEVTLTTHQRVMPLVRYALRDLARYELAPCPCPVGSSWPSLILEGRTRDAFVRNSGCVTQRRVDDALAQLDLEVYQLRELRSGEFELAVVGSLEARSLSALEALLEPRSLSVRQVDRLELDASQKFRYLVPYTE